MSEKMNFDFDEIMKMSAEMDIIDEKDIVTEKDIEEMGIPMPPSGMKERILKACADSKAQKKKPFRMKKIILIAAALIILIAGALSVEGVRVHIFGIKNQVNENSIEFRGLNENAYSYDAEESQAYTTAEEALGTSILKPSYMPDGYKFDRIKIYPEQSVITTYKNGDKSIRINQKLLIEQITTGDIVDTKDGIIYTFKAHGKEIGIAEHEQSETGDKWLSSVWDNEKISYKVEGNCSREEFEKFIKNLK